MKQIILAVLLFFTVGQLYAQDNGHKVIELLSGVIKFENTNVNSSRPIADIKQLASEQAAKKFDLTKNNINEVLDEAKTFQYCLIVVENHTVVLVESWSNCIQSGSWKYCMPYGSGYIQRGQFVKKEDHINNIIGIPDTQKRAVFLFNKK